METHDQFSTIKEILNQYPILKARQTIIGGLDTVSNAQWLLERKRKNEFSIRKEITGGDGEALPILVKFINGKDNRDTPRVQEAV